MATNLINKKILITSGPTRANIDDVRFLSNRSSGRLGTCIANELLSKGAAITLIAGPGSITPSPNSLPGDTGKKLEVMKIETVSELLSVLQAELENEESYDAVIHAMAVLDYEPAEIVQEKVKSGKETWTLHLKKTSKVIDHIKTWAPETLLIGFKLESNASEEYLIDSALYLMEKTHAALVVANDLKKITENVHPALLIDDNKVIFARPNTKEEIAGSLCKFIQLSI